MWKALSSAVCLEVFMEVLVSWAFSVETFSMVCVRILKRHKPNVIIDVSDKSSLFLSDSHCILSPVNLHNSGFPLFCTHKIPGFFQDFRYNFLFFFFNVASTYSWVSVYTLYITSTPFCLHSKSMHTSPYSHP